MAASSDPARRVREALAGDDVALFRAPGRVNLMGDHTDYNDGFVLPLAIDRECVVAARRREDGRIRVQALDMDAVADLPADGGGDPAQIEPDWARYVGGVAWALAEEGRTPQGVAAAVASSVPAGSGLSSSAAFEVSMAMALADAARLEIGAHELACACQRAEQAATRVRTGIMDQLASVAGRRDHALLIDCRSLDLRPVPLPPSLAVLVVHSGVQRALASSEYERRREACEEIARELGVRALRDATPEQVRGRPLARHVVSENARVHRTAQALEAGEPAEVGRLMLESHASLRDDYRVSIPELDLLVELLVEAGALGSRLTGAGFGGCVVALCERERAQEVADAATARYRERGAGEPTAFICRAVDGAGQL
jgi:galactokinase